MRIKVVFSVVVLILLMVSAVIPGEAQDQETNANKALRFVAQKYGVPIEDLPLLS